MSSELATAPVTPGFHKATSELSATLGVEPRMMVESLKKQCFPSMRPEDISDAQLAAFVSVANTLQLNPLIPGMLYAYPSKNGGIVPVSGPDGVLKKLDEQIAAGKLDGYECVLFPEDVTLPPTHAVAKIWRKGSDRPAVFTAIFKEWVVGSNPNWGARPRHMLWLRAIKQCARQVIHGVPMDEDDIKIGDMVNVTPETHPAPERPTPPKREKKGAAAVAENPPASAPVEVVATPVVEKTAEKVTEKTPEPKPATTPEPAKEPAKDEPKPTPEAKRADSPTARAFLKDGEEVTCECTVVEVAGLTANIRGTPTPSVQATVRGGFTGTIYDFGGATLDGTTITPKPAWKAGNVLTLTLLGKLNSKSGKVLVNATKVEEAKSESPAAVEVE
jgi:hypothetical protein